MTVPLAGGNGWVHGVGQINSKCVMDATLNATHTVAKSCVVVGPQTRSHMIIPVVRSVVKLGTALALVIITSSSPDGVIYHVFGAYWSTFKALNLSRIVSCGFTIMIIKKNSPKIEPPVNPAETYNHILHLL
jgi:hypothetical protein